MKQFLGRCGQSAMALLKALDILLCTIWLGLLWPWGLSSRPTGRQFISTYVGGAAYHEHRWALVAQWLIDHLFEFLGDGPSHCYRAWRKYDEQDN